MKSGLCVGSWTAYPSIGLLCSVNPMSKIGQNLRLRKGQGEMVFCVMDCTMLYPHGFYAVSACDLLFSVCFDTLLFFICRMRLHSFIWLLCCCLSLLFFLLSLVRIFPSLFHFGGVIVGFWKWIVGIWRAIVGNFP